MQRPPLSEIRVGLMVVLSTLLLIALSISVGQWGNLFQDTIRVRIQIPSVAGLEAYSPVRYAGVHIGRVMRIDYDETIDQAIIIADIRRDSPVSLDSICQLTASTLLSPLYVEIIGGSDEEKLKILLRENKIQEEEIILKAQPYLSYGDMFALAGDIKSTLIKVQQVLDQMNEPLMAAGDIITNISEESGILLNRTNLLLRDGHTLMVNTLENTNRLIVSASEELMPALENLKFSAEKLPQSISEISDKINTLLKRADQLVLDIEPEFKSILMELKTALQSVQERVAQIETGFTTLLKDADALLEDNRADIRSMVQYLHRTSTHLDSLLEQLSRHPWRAVWKTEARKEPSKVSPDWNPVLNKP